MDFAIKRLIFALVKSLLKPLDINVKENWVLRNKRVVLTFSVCPSTGGDLWYGITAEEGYAGIGG